MRIGINARYLQNNRSGIAQYTYYLLLNLKKIDRKNEYVLFLGSNKRISDDILDFCFPYDVSRLPTTNQIFKIAWQHLYLPCRIKNLRIEVFHEPNFIAPFFKRCPTVITVHDLAYKLLPDCFTFRNRLYLDQLIKRNIDTSDRVIAVSESTKKDIMLNYKIKEQKVKVVYEGVDEAFHPITDSKEEKSALVKAKYGITGDFILTVSLITPRKNLVNLIRAFTRLKQKAAIDHQLVIVGKKGWLFKEVFEEAAASEYQKDIIFCGFVPRDDLVMLYNAADVFVYPSLYEGFGLPLLEAMACNCPVVASNRSSITEVCSDAALLVEPHDPVGLADAIFRILSDTSLRKSLVEKGRMRVAVFSWRRTAEETMRIYNSLIR